MKSYPKYKDSGVEWLGEIPAHWEIRRLKYAAACIPSNVDKKSKEEETPVKLCNYTDVYYNDNITSNIKFMNATASSDQIKKFTLKIEDVIITKDSEDPNDIAVPSFVSEQLENVLCGYHLALIRSNRISIGFFIKWFFESRFARSTFATFANGLTRYGLGTYSINNSILPLPPLPEQKTIANFLDRETKKIDHLIEKQEQMIALLEEKRQALISHAVTKGLNPKAKMKDSGVEWLGDIPAHWEVKKIGSVYKECNRSGNDNLPILSVSIHSGISDKELNDEELDRKVARSEDKSKYKEVLPNDLAYNMMRAWQGGFGACTTHGMVSPAYIVARPTEEINSKWTEHLLRTPKAVTELKRYSRGITDFRLRLYWDEFKIINIVIPPKDEMISILKHIQDSMIKIDNLINHCNGFIELLKEKRSSLISAAVTGKIDVREEV